MQVVSGAGRPTPTDGAAWVEHLRVPDLSLAPTRSPPGRRIRRSPTPDEALYVCTHGRATLWTPSGSTAVEPGTVVFVPAGEEHRFVDVEEDLTVFVVFGPAEESRASARWFKSER